MTTTIIIPMCLVLQDITELFIDYDNTAGATEKDAFRACCSVVNEVLTKKGITKKLRAPELMKTFVGRSFRDMIELLSHEHGFGFEDGELATLVEREQKAVIAILSERVRPAPGINEFLARNSARTNPLGTSIVSGSARPRLEACLNAAGQSKFFASHRVFSGASQSSIKNKPAPDIYLHAMAQVGARPETSLAVEDSVSGLTAALQAGIPCLGYVGCIPRLKRAEQTRKLLDHGAIGVFWDWAELQLAS